MITASTHKIDTFVDFERLIKYSEAVQSNIITVDVETNSKSEKLALLWGIGICFNDKKAFYLVWRDQQGNKIWTEEQEAKITNWLLTVCQKKKLINHNIIYDVLVIENNLGIDLTPHIYSDTILLNHTIDEEAPPALKELAVLILGSWADKAQQALKDSVLANGGSWNAENKDMYLADTDVLAEYCMWDVLLTYKLFNILEKKLFEDGLDKLFYEDEIMPLYRECTIPMKRKGFPIDVAHFQKLKVDIEKELMTIEEELMEDLKVELKPFLTQIIDKEVPIKSGGNFPKVVADRLGIPLPVTKDGKVTLSAKALELQRKANPSDAVFYDWISDDTVNPFPYAADERIYDIRLNMLINKNNEKALKEGKKPVRYAFNLNSSDHLGWYFFTHKKYKPLDKSEKTGKPKADAKFIDSVTGNDPQAQKIIDFKKLQKLYGTYVNGILSREIDGVIYASYLQFGTTSGRYSSTNPNCLSMDTQILTNEGWKYHHQLTLSDKVAQFDDQVLTWVHPTNIWKSNKKVNTMTSIKNGHLDILTTSDHRILYQNDDSLKYHQKPAKDVPNSGRILHGSYCSDVGFTIDKNFLRLLVAIQADAEIKKDSNRIRFVFTKERKYTRLLEILSKLNYSYEDRSKKGRYEIYIDEIKPLVLSIIGYAKQFPSSWLQLSPECRLTFLEELFHWDGSFTRKNNYSSNEEHNVDIVQALCALEGWRAHKRIYKTKVGNNNYQVDITRQNWSGLTNRELTSYEEECEVWCIQVPSEKFLARRGKNTFIIYNCQNLPRIKDDEAGLSEVVLKYVNAIKQGFVAPKGYKIVNADYSSLEPVCFADNSGSEALRDIFRTGKDLYSQVAIDVNKLNGQYSADKKAPNFLKKHRPELRQLWKVPTLGLVYGMEEARLMQAIGCDRKTATSIITGYLGTYPDLKNYMKTCESSAKKYGQVKTVFGRVRHLPEAKILFDKYGDKLLDWRWASQKGLLQERRKFKQLLNNSKNFPIQGLAAHIVNRAMIAIARKFKKENIDAWISAQIHDEITCMASAKQSQAALEIVKDCMENTTKISIPLSAEPIIASNWAEAK